MTTDLHQMQTKSVSKNSNKSISNLWINFYTEPKIVLSKYISFIFVFILKYYSPSRNYFNKMGKKILWNAASFILSCV